MHALPWSAAGYVPPLSGRVGVQLRGAALVRRVGIAGVLRVRRGQHATSRRVATLAVFAGIVVIGGFALDDRLSGRTSPSCGTPRRSTPIRSWAASVAPTAIIGEVVRVTGRQGAWSRVVLDDGRDGWIENAALVSLDAQRRGSDGSSRN